jgi:hypothetical protein
MRKTCTHCNKEKLFSEFYKKVGREQYAGSISYYDSACIPCAKVRQQKYRDRLTPEQRKNIDLKCMFGITIEQWNKLFENQSGCCAICKMHQSEFKRKLSVDHNHKTGTVRGLLCMECNTGIGKFKDSIDNLNEAISYLKNNAESADLNSDVAEVIQLRK